MNKWGWAWWASVSIPSECALPLLALRGTHPSAERLLTGQIRPGGVTDDLGSDPVLLYGSGAVEACLLHQLRRRAAGFLRSDKMAALFTKMGKTYPVAGDICHKVQELQQQAEGR